MYEATRRKGVILEISIRYSFSKKRGDMDNDLAYEGLLCPIWAVDWVVDHALETENGLPTKETTTTEKGVSTE